MRLLTKRLEVRPWNIADADALVDGLNDLEVTRWLARVPNPYSRSDAERWIEYCEALPSVAQGGRSLEWAIALRDGGRAIGGVSLERIDRIQRTAGGGVWISTRYRGFGYGQEAFSEKVRYAFEELGLRRLENGFIEGNDASWSMQERLGYCIEGTRRCGLMCMADGRIVNEILTGLLREEWRREV